MTRDRIMARMRNYTILSFLLAAAAFPASAQIVGQGASSTGDNGISPAGEVPAGQSGIGRGQLARLIRNPQPGQGLPPYALTDQTGKVQRYVEPVSGVQLDQFVNRVVIVRHDTGRTLLATQLEFPAESTVAGLHAAPATEMSRAPATGGLSAFQPAVFLHGSSLQENAPDLAEPLELDAGNPAPSWAGEELPPGVEPVYLDGPGGDIVDTPHNLDHYYGYENCPIDGPCYGPGGEGCNCSHCRHPHRTRRDRGLLAGVFDDRYRPAGCAPGARGLFYLRGEYLHWWFDGMHVPPLVVQGMIEDNGTPGDPTDDVLVGPFTTLFGGGESLDDNRNGLRLVLGYFLDDCGSWALEGEHVHFGSESDVFSVTGTEGDSIGIGRPFFAVPPGVDDMGMELPLPRIEDVDFTNINGTVTANITSDFETAGIRFKYNLCCSEGCQPNRCSCGDGVACGSYVSGCGCGGGNCRRSGFGTRRIDWTVGARYANLDEWLAINENLREINAPNTTFVVNDTFSTDNYFVGADFGFVWEWEYRRWKIDMLQRLAVGNTRQRVVINGSTIIDGAAPVPGGLLTQTTNIGTYSKDKLSVLPELALNVGYQLTANLSFTLGYTFLYWSSVVRPGDQIDLDVNPLLIPRDNAVPITPQPFDRPRVLFEDTDFFAHGINLGLEYRR